MMVMPSSECLLLGAVLDNENYLGQPLSYCINLERIIQLANYFELRLDQALNAMIYLVNNHIR